MKAWLQRSAALAVVVLVVSAGCSSGDAEDGSPTPSDEQTTGEVSTSAPSDEETAGDVGSASEMDANFDAGSLPDDFPSELMPDSFAAGMYAELGTVRSANFESTSSFDDVVAEYTAKIGEEPILVEGEERLASWTVDIWIVSIIEDNPVIIGLATAD